LAGNTNPDTPFPAANPAATSTAFADGAGISQVVLRDFVLSLLSVSLLLWGAWFIRAQFSNWRDGKIVMFEMQHNVLLGLSLLSLVLFITLA
jgi:integrating conjugative element protein (TIGR03758 family)